MKKVSQNFRSGRFEVSGNVFTPMKKTKLKPGLEIYQEPNSDWRWRFVRKGRITHASSEGYRNLEECKANITAGYDLYWAGIDERYAITPLKPAKGKAVTLFQTPKASAKWLAKVQAKGKAAK